MVDSWMLISVLALIAAGYFFWRERETDRKSVV